MYRIIVDTEAEMERNTPFFPVSAEGQECDMRITQKEIAKRLGISLITVSRALNGTGYVSQDLKDEITAFAKKHNYVPSKASQVLVRNKQRRIALFSSSLPAYFWDEIRRGVDVAAQQLEGFNYRITYHNIPEYDSDLYISELERLYEAGLDAVGFVNQRKYDMDRIIAKIDSFNIPYVTFNVDAPRSKRTCYIGSDYAAGGRIAAEFIGKMLRLKEQSSVLVINLNEDTSTYSDAPDINTERLKGFLQIMREQYPRIACEIRMITTHYQPELMDSQIRDILTEREGKVDAVYLIPAFNRLFLDAIDTLDYHNTVTVLHDLDKTAISHLETNLLTAAIYQNPILQGYYTVKVLERILEAPEGTPFENTEIIHNIVMAENKDLVTNLYVHL